MNNKQNLLIVSVLLMLFVMPMKSYCQVPVIGHIPKNVLQFKARYGLIDWQQGIKGFNLDLSGIDPDSALGKELDLKQVVTSVIKRNPATRRDSIWIDYNQALFDTIKINSTQFTDIMIKYNAKVIIRALADWVQYDTLKNDYRGNPIVTKDWSLLYSIAFGDEFDIDKIKSELESIDLIENVSKPGVPKMY